MNILPSASRLISIVLFGCLLVLVAPGGIAAVGHHHNEPVASCETTTPGLITWFPKEFECPVCQTKNTFMVVGSYGNYIYSYPSKYQLIFWPFTDSPSWYSCKKCRLTIFMGEFEQIPPNKIPELRKMLETTTLPAQPDRGPKESADKPPYLEISTDLRVAIAEKVYKTLGKADDNFWDHFYRVLAYHYDRNGKTAEAEQARRKSIEINERLLKAKADGARKERLYILGAMRHFTGDDAGALKVLEEAAALKYKDDALSADKNEGYDGYLSEVIKEYVEMLKKGEGPRTNKALRSTSH